MTLGSGAFPVGCRESGVDCHIHLLLLCAPFPPLLRMPFPKPLPRRLEKRRQRTARNGLIAAVRRAVVARDVRCRCCGERFATGEQTPEMHELRSRAQLRGRDPTDIWNRANCLLLCRRCHRGVTDHRITLTPADAEQGADGVVEVERRME